MQNRLLDIKARVEQSLMVREKLNTLGELAGGVVHNFNNIPADFTLVNFFLLSHKKNRIKEYKNIIAV